MEDEVKKENIDIKKLVLNEGQIPGVPKNPRFIKDSRYQSLVQSIQDDPEMLDLREPLVFPQGDKYVVIGGNMRVLACKELKFKQVPCKILPADTPAEKLRAYAIKDNVSGGEWDFDILANAWDEVELKQWGFEDVDLGWIEEGAETYDYSDLDKELDDMEGLEDVNITVTVPKKYKDEIMEWLANGEQQTAPGIGKGIMKRCGLL